VNAHSAARRRWTIRASLAVGLGVLAIAVEGGRAARAELDVLKPRRWVVPRRPDDATLATLRDVEMIVGNGVHVRGWLVPSKTGAAIVLVHGAGADRRQLLPEAAILAAAGYGVLLFDLPGNGESEGGRWQGLEQAATLAAVGALESQPETNRGRIGALGFSIGAAVVVDVAGDPRLQAFALAGCFTDIEAHKRDDYRKWGPISQLPALWVDHRYAGELARLRPIDQIAAIAPRPLLLVAGDADGTVPLHHALKLFAAAGDPKALFVVRGADHGNYAAIAHDEYARRLVAFFDRALERAP